MQEESTEFLTFTQGDVGVGNALESENVLQKPQHLRRARRQSSAWRSALWVAFSTALVFLIMKCIMQLPANKTSSFRRLAEGGGDEHTPFRHSSGSEDDFNTCGGRDGLRRRSRGGSDSGWKKFWRRSFGWTTDREQRLISSSPESVDEERPTTSSPESVDEESLTSSSESLNTMPGPSGQPTRRVRHESLVFAGIPNSPHYQGIDRLYNFGRLGEKNEDLRKKMKKLQKFAQSLCDAHEGLSSKVFQAKHNLDNGNGSIVISVKIEEISSSESGSPIDPSAALHPDSLGLDGRHFCRDVALIVEEMVTEVIREAETTDMAEGLTTLLFYNVRKPSRAPNRGKVLLEVFAGKEDDSE